MGPLMESHDLDASLYFYFATLGKAVEIQPSLNRIGIQGIFHTQGNLGKWTSSWTSWCTSRLRALSSG